MKKDETYYKMLESTIDEGCGAVTMWYEDDRTAYIRKILQNAKTVIQHLRSENNDLKQQISQLQKDNKNGI